MAETKLGMDWIGHELAGLECRGLKREGLAGIGRNVGYWTERAGTELIWTVEYWQDRAGGDW